jgi:hypothetical protein
MRDHFATWCSIATLRSAPLKPPRHTSDTTRLPCARRASSTGGTFAISPGRLPWRRRRGLRVSVRIRFGSPVRQVDSAHASDGGSRCTSDTPSTRDNKAVAWSRRGPQPSPQSQSWASAGVLSRSAASRAGVADRRVSSSSAGRESLVDSAWAHPVRKTDGSDPPPCSYSSSARCGAIGASMRVILARVWRQRGSRGTHCLQSGHDAQAVRRICAVAV